jgi:hypothetical protein
MLRQGKPAQVTVDEANESTRVYNSIRDKCTTYKQIVESRKIPYVIGFFPQFQIAIDRSQIIDNLYLPPHGLFLSGDLGGYPNVSGLVNLSESRRIDNHDSLWLSYTFEYFANPYAVHSFAFPSGSYFNPMIIAKRDEYRRAIQGFKAHNEYNQQLMRVLQSNHMADVFAPLLQTLRSMSPEPAARSQEERAINHS